MSELKIVIGNKRYSSWSLRGWLAVKLSGLPFDEIKLCLDRPEFYESIAQYTPTNCVPVLHHGETVIWDSLAIIDYIDRLCPDLGLWPSDGAAFGNAKAISCEMHSGFSALRNAVPMNIGKAYTGLGLSDAVAKDVTRIDALWCDTRSKFGDSGSFLFGDFSAADIMYAPVVHRFNDYGLPRSASADAYIKAMLDHPAMKTWTADALQEQDILDHVDLDQGTRVLG